MEQLKLWDKEKRRYVDVPNTPENRVKLAQQMKDPIHIDPKIYENSCQRKWETNKRPLTDQDIETIKSLGMSEKDLDSVCNREKLLNLFADGEIVFYHTLLHDLIASVPNASEILSKSNPLENKTETFSMRMTPKEMQLLFNSALRESGIKNKAVTVTDIVREKLFPSDANEKCFSDWDSFDMRMFESMTRSTEIETIINHPLKNMLTASKIFSHDEEMKKSRRDALLGKIPSIGKIYMISFEDDGEETPEDVLNKMAMYAKDTILNFMEKETIETLRQMFPHPELSSYYVQKSLLLKEPRFDVYSEMKEEAFLKIIKKNCPVAKILCSHEVFHYLVNNDKNFEESTRKDVVMSNFHGHLGSADVHVINQMEEKEMFILSSAEKTGRMSYVWHIEPFKDSDGYGWNLLANIHFSDLHDVGCRLLV